MLSPKKISLMLMLLTCPKRSEVNHTKCDDTENIVLLRSHNDGAFIFSLNPVITDPAFPEQCPDIRNFLSISLISSIVYIALKFHVCGSKMNDYYSVYADYRKKIDDILSASITKNIPATLYEPITYVLKGGGKRIRPMMVIFSCEAAGGSFEDSVNAAVALEMLHNFTLVHDDIMDNADTRRGEPTVYRKWDSNVAILTGDQLIGLAYVYLLKTSAGDLAEITRAFTDGIIEVCEGQAFDKEFESRTDVTPDEYMMMIRKKTAKMLETSASVGAHIGGANRGFVNSLKEFALNTGLAFQILDDLLDITADEVEFGKKRGGDVIEGKKTYLLLKALESAGEGRDRDLIRKIIDGNGLKNADESAIEEVKQVYERCGAIESAKNEISRYTSLAKQCLASIPASEGRSRLEWLSEMLMDRKI